MLYGGAAGGGKSYAMLVDPLRFMHIKEHRALLLRKSMPELRELIDRVTFAWHMLSEEDQDYIHGCQYAIEDQIEWSLQ